MEATFWIMNSVAVFAISMVCTCLIIPRILHFAFSKQMFDIPEERKIHKGCIPRLGGIAFLPAIMLSLMATLAFNDCLAGNILLNAFTLQPRTIIYGGSALLMLYMVGIADDFSGVSYIVKFGVQILAALMLMLGGLGVSSLGGLFGIYYLGYWGQVGATFLGVLLVVNAINLIDGLDGLASGIAMLALISYTIFFYACGAWLEVLISVATLGVMLSFFYFNVFGAVHRAQKIFMGDTGSLTLGFMLVLLAFRLLNVSTTHYEELHNISTFLLSFTPLSIPCFDTVRVFIERIIAGDDPFMPDRRHIHYVFLEAGIGRRTTMALILLFALFLSILNIFMAQYAALSLIIIADVAIYCLIMLLARRKTSSVSLQI